VSHTPKRRPLAQGIHLQARPEWSESATRARRDAGESIVDTEIPPATGSTRLRVTSTTLAITACGPPRRMLRPAQPNFGPCGLLPTCRGVLRGGVEQWLPDLSAIVRDANLPEVTTRSFGREWRSIRSSLTISWRLPADQRSPSQLRTNAARHVSVYLCHSTEDDDFLSSVSQRRSDHC
jgi:hypothetical protein